MVETQTQVTPAIGAKKLFPVKEGNEGGDLTFAPVIGFVEFSRVQWHRFENQALRLLNYLELLGNRIVHVIKNRGPGSLLGEGSLPVLKSEGIALRVGDPHFDDTRLIHRVCQPDFSPSGSEKPRLIADWIRPGRLMLSWTRPAEAGQAGVCVGSASPVRPARLYFEAFEINLADQSDGA